MRLNETRLQADCLIKRILCLSEPFGLVIKQSEAVVNLCVFRCQRKCLLVGLNRRVDLLRLEERGSQSIVSVRKLGLELHSLLKRVYRVVELAQIKISEPQIVMGF